MLHRFGIGGRLFLAFLCITALSLTSGIVSWLILRNIADAQAVVNAQALPAVAATQRTAELSAKLIATAPALAAVTSRDGLLAEQAKLATLSQEIVKSLTEVRRLSIDPELVEAFAGSVEKMLANLKLNNELVRQRLDEDKAYRDGAEAATSAAQSVLLLSETLISNASAGASAVTASLYGLIGEAGRREDAYIALDRLIEHDIYLMERMYELRHRSAQISLLINRLGRAETRAEINEISGIFQDHVKVIRRRILSIDDPVRRKQGMEFFGAIEAAAGDAPVSGSIFGRRQRVIDLAGSLDAMAEANRDLAVTQNQIARNILDRSDEFARTTAERADNAVRIGVIVLVVTLLGAILASGAIVWFYVERNLVRRLSGLSRAMQRLTAGDLDVTVTDSGDDELRTMAVAVNQFRDESRRRLELEQERARITDELRRHREELQQLVEEQTEQIRLVNTRLRQEAIDHDEARARAEQASSAKSAFLATMSHEIRTPMTGMLGMMRLLADSRLGPKQREHLSVAASSGEALLGILNAILDYSKVESGNVGVDKIDFDLGKLVGGVVAFMRPMAAEKGLDLGLVLDRKLAQAFTGDAGKIRQILFNLVSNAIKFTEHGQVRVDVTVVANRKDMQTLRLAVADTGIGIAPERQQDVFQPFTQMDASITRRFGGTGLGLAISREFAGLIGAELQVASEPGEGSTFSLDMSLRKAKAAELSTEKQRRARKAKPPSCNILVVEDDDATRLVSTTVLANAGHRVKAVSSGYLALEAITDFRPDLVVMDVSLPGIDGIETMKRIRQALAAPDLPVVAMSAHVFKTDIARYLDAGVDAFVAKPIVHEQLLDAVASLGGPTLLPQQAHDAAALDVAAFKADVDALGSETVRRLHRIAHDSLPRRFQAMRDAVKADDREALRDLAHATRSTAGSLGFPRLLQAAEALETAAAQRPASELRQIVSACETAFGEGSRQWEEMFGEKTLEGSAAPVHPA
ncbi:two-component system sensor histidine kinase TorS [Aminobacter lissarensis]|uniref:histidine kinase n=1 Tax=Aminobacter carboxidus TaxID=376165 RepID=A0A8E1WGA5_9HYPH|nr:TMAO reductase system sensor histidine kinase/response regulator TorS [Aminobacter lissarensis]MBB6468345.1 two-component system sensor histidine kinase TorS [Aminobacter lissarensis]